MLELNKTAQLLTVSSEVTVEEASQWLKAEGFHLGYVPVSDLKSLTIGSCLQKRISNHYFLKYGGIEDLCVGGEALNSLGRPFGFKTAPRAATGPDLRRTIIGSETLFGDLNIATLRVFPFAEKNIWGFALMDHVSEAGDFLRKMLTNFIRPLCVGLPDEDMVEKLEEELKSFRDKTVLAFKLSGLAGIVEAEKETLAGFAEEQGMSLYWASRLHTDKTLDSGLLTPAFFRSCVKRFAELLHHGSDVDNLAERKLLKQAS